MNNLDKIDEIIKNQMFINFEFNDSTTFEEMKCDNLDKIEIVMAIEDEMGIEFDDIEFDSIATVGEMKQYVMFIKLKGQ